MSCTRQTRERKIGCTNGGCPWLLTLNCSAPNRANMLVLSDLFRPLGPGPHAPLLRPSLASSHLVMARRFLLDSRYRASLVTYFFLLPFLVLSRFLFVVMFSVLNLPLPPLLNFTIILSWRPRPSFTPPPLAFHVSVHIVVPRRYFSPLVLPPLP